MRKRQCMPRHTLIAEFVGGTATPGGTPTEPVGRNQGCSGCNAMASPSAHAPRREAIAGSETTRSLGDHVINSSRRTGAAPKE
jgi:hypothetical protein